MKEQTSSADKFMGISTIHALDDGRPYMTRYWFGRLRLHIFYQGDPGNDVHDHPWDFWTLPLNTSYLELVTTFARYGDEETGEIKTAVLSHYEIVPRWKFTFRKAVHLHRVIGPFRGDIHYGARTAGDVYYSGRVSYFGTSLDAINPASRLPKDAEVYPEHGRIVTLVWRSEPKRVWGFLKHRDGRWCWQAWKEYRHSWRAACR